MPKFRVEGQVFFAGGFSETVEAPTDRAAMSLVQDRIFAMQDMDAMAKYGASVQEVCVQCAEPVNADQPVTLEPVPSLLAAYVSADDIGLPREELLRLVRDRITDDLKASGHG